MPKKIWAIIVVIVIIVSSVAAYWYTQQKEEKGKAMMKVEIGDTVKVNYTGRFSEGNFFDNGTVFDTSIKSVANDENISKAYSFKSRASYSPLEFEVGKRKLIKSFDEGVLNMTVDETKNITVLPEDGYGIPDEDLRITINKTQSVPLYETISSQEFHGLYPNEIAEKSVCFKHWFWGWKVTVDDIDDNNITIMNLPDNGSTINVFGWNSTILERNNSYNGGEGRILLQHNPVENITLDKEKTEFLKINNEPLNYISLQINLGNLSVSDIGIVSSINEDKDTFTVDYNPEVVGKTLVFELTIVSINRG